MQVKNSSAYYIELMVTRSILELVLLSYALTSHELFQSNVSV